MHQHDSYEPVATAVPVVPNKHSQDLEASLFSDLAEDDAAHHSHFEDAYFDGRSEVITSFDYDRERRASESRKIKLCLWTPLLVGAAHCFGVGLAYFIVVLLSASFFSYMEAVRKSWDRSMHLGITNTSILFEEEQHLTWYGSERATKQEFFFADIGVTFVEKDGSSVACFACMDHVLVYRRPYSMEPDLVVRGLKDTPAFYALLMRKRATKVARRPQQSLPTDVEENLGLELPFREEVVPTEKAAVVV